MSVISKLFWNEDFIHSINDDSDREKSESKIRELRKELVYKMDPQQEKIFDEFCSEINMQNGDECECAFYLGFKAAFKIMSDISGKELEN